MPANVFAVLADPTRRRLVEILYAGERPVNDLVAEVEIEQPGVSRHLRILHDAGFVTVRAEGQRRVYALKPEPLRQLETWLHRYPAEQLERLRRLSDLVDERPKRRK